MEVLINKNEDNITFDVSGRIDSLTSNDLESTIKENLGDYKDVIINFSNVEYISSAGLRVLLSLHKLLKDGDLKIINVNEVVKEIFDVTGFIDILNIVEE